MRSGGIARRRMIKQKGPQRQSRMRSLQAAQKRTEKRRTLLRRGQPPRAMRSMRTTQSDRRPVPIMRSLAKSFRCS